VPVLADPIAAPVPAPVVTPAPAGDRSPWAAPPIANDGAVPAPVVDVPVAAAPVVAAPVVAAPVVAAPVVSRSQGKKPAAEDKAGDSKGRFRETMWFKKGDLDAQAAVDAAEQRARTGKDGAADKADSMPMDQRYQDDGSISRGDKEKYSLRTGGTQMLPQVRDERGDASTSLGKVSEDALIGEMKGGRTWIVAAIGLAVISLAVVVYLLAA
jgi:hypothetical protein